MVLNDYKECEDMKTLVFNAANYYFHDFMLPRISRSISIDYQKGNFLENSPNVK